MKSVRRLIPYIMSSCCIAVLPLTAHAETDACTLLTPAQLGTAAGGAFGTGTHVTPTFDELHRVIGYHSNRRVPERREVDMFSEIYRQLLQEERSHSDWRAGMEAATRMLTRMIEAKGMHYDEFVFSA